MDSKLPKNWEIVNVSEFVSLLEIGGRPRGGAGKLTEGIPSISAEHFNYGGGFKFEKLKFITEEFYEKLNKGKIKNGDVLVVKDGATTGKSAYIDNKFPFDKAAVNEHTFIIRTYEGFENKLLFYFTLSSDFNNYILNTIGGSTIGGIKKGFINELRFNLPPLAEQQRIVAKLDTLFGSLDALKIRLNNIPQLIKNFKQAVLTQAVTGKLTQEWRVGKELEYASLLNKNNQVEFEIINFDFLPNNWLKTALGNYANCSRGKFSVRPRNDPRYFDGNYPFMQIGDLPREGGYTSDYSKTLNEEGIKVSKSFPKGTVVVAIVGATIGLTGILEKEMFFPDSLIGLNCENFISNQYLEYYLRLCKNGFREISYAGGGQPNIKLPTIKNLELLIPPLKEQTEIVKRVENLFSKADAIEKQYKTLKEKIDRLPQAILAKAFKGELVAQLPTDGDAKDLLEEIKKLKESLVVKPKKKVVRNKK
ncbi:restriction endonuclease subunit S [Tenacibaculum finnmarkense]|uniref:restriction endonuclease subunit S n=1 Tax=Tenacibaculum finnmarkense TaxID=2781243 RepID=UPI001E44A681|nr:restriction endonuclease subunit S [Tenacibaculum finnmarkense]MCD8409667.1 restriction endonuclease subunit S [Tenacibaculum finnmarkense genomovar ulcerans]MCG8748963.1 hypothetical protein [Tenacibaculum finnmarkense]